MAYDLTEDPTFFERADQCIALANDQCGGSIDRAKVSLSMMYGTARFNAWNAACWSRSDSDLKAKRQEYIKYFVEQYQSMLEDHLDDYIAKFDEYVPKTQA